ncbi:ligase-associated DNA damage response DEXH box helicase [Pseudovibrio exalbescens]|uniref:DNA ligase-associated DEXH box helicase n=1 Tax=Pseudovibrio exalbescens TaxID=197461 RepID=A0A1U7JD67_9HYPH|nr:ligase-associated DNA damage response DEXH box helicase [Pseudovibrio exalbescens]OKL42634.1 DNA ligase-associated DEXH box helicase [Pseudovibrio exalbescens]
METHRVLPRQFEDWFNARSWHVRSHQLSLLDTVRTGQSALLIAPTGAGKTLAGFLPTLISLSQQPAATPEAPRGVHTLYISPLKALATDIQRNLERPITDMQLPIKMETRTGDTPTHKRQRQKRQPPDILLTTPEQIALLLADKASASMFENLQTIILDELHELVTSKRGDLLSLGLTRLRTLSPKVQCIGLSATVAEPDELRAFLMDQRHEGTTPALAELVLAQTQVKPEITILDSAERLPWAGHSAHYALNDIYDQIRTHKTTLVFVNTRSQAEVLFQELWRINEDTLPIALHHGSLDVAQRRKVEEAMARGALKAVVCTSSLDLGIDWGDIDLVINVGAPKGASRLAQRIGRANHRMDEPSKAILVPANRFEVLECQAALAASTAGEQDTPPLRYGGLDVLAQHIMGMACAEPFDADDLFAEVKGSFSYRTLTRDQFDKALEFVATGGYALRSYDRFARLRETKNGRYRVAHPSIAQRYRLNIGTIVADAMLKVRLVKPRRGKGDRPLGRGGRVLGEVEEWFAEQLAPGDTFVFSGEILRFEGLQESEAYVSRTTATEPKVPSFQGGKFPLSTYLADRVRTMLGQPNDWHRLPPQVGEWLRLQQLKSQLPRPDRLLVETFPRGRKHYMVCYPFEGRLAHQTLGMLLTRRLDRAGLHPMGFVASDYALALWSMKDIGAATKSGLLDLGALFDADMLGDDLDAWLAESALMKRTFRACAVIAGLIERRFPGQEKTGRQVTMSTDLVYDVLRTHEPDHLLMKATWADAATGLLDISRLSEFLSRIQGRIDPMILQRVSPLAVPVLLEIGREPIYGETNEALLASAADDLALEAMA